MISAETGPAPLLTTLPSRTSSDEPPPISNRIDTLRIRAHQRRAADRGQLRLGLAIDDFQLDPDLLGDADEEMLAILGRPAGLGRDQAGAA